MIYEDPGLQERYLEMSERRNFLKLLAAGPAGALLLPVFAESGKGTMAADLEDVAEILGRLPDNIIHSEAHQGVWKGKAGSHVPKVDIKKSGNKFSLAVETKHPMSEKHYIVRHTIVTDCGKVLGAKTFSWEDKPVSECEFELDGKCKQLFVMSYCNLHDLWVAPTVLEV